MKKVVKILLIVLLMMIITLFMVQNVNANSYLEDAVSDIEEYTTNANDRSQSFFDNLDMSEIFDMVSWPVTIAWIVFFGAAIIGFFMKVWPAIKALVTGKDTSQAWETIVTYVILVIVALVILLVVFPFIAKFDFS